MTVVLFADPDHKAVVFAYDKDAVSGEMVHVKATNDDTGDVGTRDVPNSGSFVLFYPTNFSGSDTIEVTGSDGGTETGSVSIP